MMDLYSFVINSKIRKLLGFLIVLNFIVFGAIYFYGHQDIDPDTLIPEVQISDLNRVPRKERVKFLGIEDSQVSFLLVSEKGDRLQGENEDVAISAASNAKILTAALALRHIPADFRFHTETYLEGKMTGSHFEGAIVLLSDGDPDVKYQFFSSILHKLRRHGIQSLSFDLKLVPKGKVRPRRISNFQELSIHNMHFNDLNYNDNVIGLYYRKKSDGIYYAPIPYTSRGISEVQEIFEEKDIPYVSGPGELFIRVDSKYLFDKKHPLKNPVMHHLGFLRQMICREFKCSSNGTDQVLTRGSLLKTMSLLDSYQSEPLIRLVQRMIQESRNIIAEGLIQKITRDMGEERLLELPNLNPLLIKSFPQISWVGAEFRDSAGIDPGTKFTARQMVGALRELESLASVQGYGLRDLLSVAGINGTLWNRMGHPFLSNQVYAKTGTLLYTSSLSGIFISSAQNKSFFSILIHDQDQRKLLGLPVLERLSSKEQKTENEWTEASREYMDSMLLDWISERI